MYNKTEFQNLGAILLLLITLLFFSQVANADDKSDKVLDEKSQACQVEAFAGTYKIVRGEKEGVKLKAKELKATKVVIHGNRITTLDKQDGELYVAEFQLQPHDKGCYIVMNSIKPPMPGIGAVGLIDMNEEGRVRLIYGFPDSEAPQNFKTEKGQHMFVMKKVDQPSKVKKPAVVPVN